MPDGTTVLRLEELRKRRGLSLEQISSRTKIGIQFLRSIEAEEFDKLPGGVFNTSFIRQYAVAVDCSEDDLLEQYAMFERSRLRADENVQAECEARRGWTFRCVNWLRTFPAARPVY